MLCSEHVYMWREQLFSFALICCCEGASTYGTADRVFIFRILLGSYLEYRKGGFIILFTEGFVQLALHFPLNIRMVSQHEEEPVDRRPSRVVPLQSTELQKWLMQSKIHDTTEVTDFGWSSKSLLKRSKGMRVSFARSPARSRFKDDGINRSLCDYVNW